MKNLFKSFSFLLSLTLILASCSSSNPDKIERWGMFELELTGPDTGNPFTDVTLSAEFSNGELTFTPQGFYDGNAIYRIRFMPSEKGKWTYTTLSNIEEMNGIQGKFTCVKASEENHGPVGIRNTYYLAYEDGTPYNQIGTTCYAWTHQGDEMEEQTLQTLAKAPFNKLRMCIFPKSYSYNHNEPVFYPFEGEPPKDWDFTQFNPEFWQHFEQCVLDLQKLGIEADIVLFHTYDRWGFEFMDKESDERYIKYAVARLSAYRNVWWSLANEYDFMPDKEESDWDRFFQIIRDNDPYQRLRGIHNGRRWYDHNKPWVTHASIQTSDMRSGIRFREKYKKPVIYDECKYEGNIPDGWGHLTPEEMTRRFWHGTLGGCYVGHGETYQHPEDLLWWAKGGVLRGESPARIAFMKEIMSKAPAFEDLQVLGDDKGNFILGIPGEYYLVYGKTTGNTLVNLEGDRPYKIDAIDTWEMKETPYGTARPGQYAFASQKENMVYRFTPYAPGEKIRPEAVATSNVNEGNAPLRVEFSSHTDLKTEWNFGDGSTSDENNPSHVFKKFGRYLVTLTVTDKAGLSASAAVAISVLPAAPEDILTSNTWPGSTSGMEFSWKNDAGSRSIKAQGEAIINGSGEMVLTNGSFKGLGVDESLKEACQQSNQLTVEAVITIENLKQGGPARIISFSKDTQHRNFTMGQENNNIVMRLRTPSSGPNAMNPTTTLCEITPGKPMHIIVTYYPGNMYAYLNGELVLQSGELLGDFSTWEPCQLIFGNEVTGDRKWEGKLKNVSVYSRFMGSEEAAHKYQLLIK